jgi:hypothetical protein
MKQDLDADAVERIWTFSIFPYIEDQLFGRPDEIAKYRWDRVLTRLDKRLATEAARFADAGVEPESVDDAVLQDDGAAPGEAVASAEQGSPDSAPEHWPAT